LLLAVRGGVTKAPEASRFFGVTRGPDGEKGGSLAEAEEALAVFGGVSQVSTLAELFFLPLMPEPGVVLGVWVLLHISMVQKQKRSADTLSCSRTRRGVARKSTRVWKPGCWLWNLMGVAAAGEAAPLPDRKRRGDSAGMPGMAVPHWIGWKLATASLLPT